MCSMLMELSAKRISRVFLDSPFKCLTISLIWALPSKINAKTKNIQIKSTAFLFVCFCCCKKKKTPALENYQLKGEICMHCTTTANYTNHCYNNVLKSHLTNIYWEWECSYCFIKTSCPLLGYIFYYFIISKCKSLLIT